MKLEEGKDKTAIIVVSKVFANNESVKSIMGTGGLEKFSAKIVDSDDIGIYVENSKYKATIANTGNKVSRLHILIPWGCLISIALFPDNDFAEADAAKPIGF